MPSGVGEVYGSYSWSRSSTMKEFGSIAWSAAQESSHTFLSPQFPRSLSWVSPLISCLWFAERACPIENEIFLLKSLTLTLPCKLRAQASTSPRLRIGSVASSWLFCKFLCGSSNYSSECAFLCRSVAGKFVFLPTIPHLWNGSLKILNKLFTF